MYGFRQLSCIQTHWACRRLAASARPGTFESMLPIQQIGTPQACGEDMDRIRSIGMLSTQSSGLVSRSQLRSPSSTESTHGMAMVR